MKGGIKALIVCDHKILLFLRDDKPECSYPLHWQIVGGGIEDGEGPEEALIREVREETSYKIKNYSFLEKVKGSRGEDVYRFLIKVNKKDVGKFKIGSEEGLEVKFFSYEELSGLKLTPGTKNYIEERKQELIKWMD